MSEDRLIYHETFLSAQVARDVVFARQRDGWRLDGGEFHPAPRRSSIAMSRPAREPRFFSGGHYDGVRSLVQRKAALPLERPTGPRIGRAAEAVQSAAVEGDDAETLDDVRGMLAAFAAAAFVGALIWAGIFWVLT